MKFEKEVTTKNLVTEKEENTTLQSTEQRDLINKPPHYNYGSIETIDYIVDVLDEGGALDYCQGNVIKYTGTRMFTKGDPKENIKKAIWYLNKMLELLNK
jgi:hypothetical protein